MLNGDFSNLNYTVVFASSYSKRNHPDNICTSSAYGNGWLSAPNALYPQEIVLDFHRSVCAEEIRVISHQFAIPKEIIFETAPDVYSWKSSKFSQITKTTFSDNKERNYKAREMKTATLPKMHFRYMKIKIPSAIQNQKNEKNQVGIVSLTVSGTVDEIFDDDEIMRLTDEKRAAVDAEDYMLAYNINNKLEAYKANKAAIDDLKKKKEEAVAKEDFTLANKYKNEIIRLSNQNSSPRRKSPVRQSYDDQMVDDDVESQQSYLPQGPPQGAPSPRRERAPSQYSARDSYQDPGESFYNQPSDADRRSFNRNSRQPSQFNQDDDFDFPERRRSQRDLEHTRQIRPMGRQQDMMDPDEIEREEPVEPLSYEAQEEASQLIDELGEEPLQYFYSKSITHRAHGIELITDAISQLPKQQRQHLYLRFMYLLKLENAPQIFTVAINSIMTLTDKGGLSRDAKHNGIDKFIPLVCNRISVDTNANRRINDLCHKFLLWAASEEVVGIQIVLDNLIRPPRKNQQSASATVKLRILLDVLSEYGDSSLDFFPICTFAGQFCESPTADVRNTTQNLFALIMDLKGKQAIEKYYNQSNDKPKMIQNLLKKNR